MTLEEKVIKILQTNGEVKTKITLNSELEEDLGIDSFAMIMIINVLEDEFGISIQTEALTDLKTVDDLIKKLIITFPHLKD